MDESCPVTQDMIAEGLRQLGLSKASRVLVHASLRSFGRVDGGAEAVCRALVDVCGTVMVSAGAWDLTGLPAPPGLTRPHNACHQDQTWQEFDDALAKATVYSKDLPVDSWLGTIAETMRQNFPHERGDHPLFTYLAVGPDARPLVDAGRLDWPLGPIEELGELGGDVLLLGVGHTSSTAIHLAEQRMGRSRFYRYAKVAPGVWMELPNIPGESHRFDEIEGLLAPVTTEVRIGRCRARRLSVSDVLSTTERLIAADPRALLCEDPECRCGAAYQQRLANLRGGGHGV
ncbi:AAC(3) family N-acetyltransferase [Actinopolymorpha sp. B9G3]|uniref:AAC(3) family N-acetyltransferase n=1 Tax=Actinopolymorpha sp. B9G3 TaxID=3158970 RepID=UPI0032D90E12